VHIAKLPEHQLSTSGLRMVDKAAKFWSIS